MIREYIKANRYVISLLTFFIFGLSLYINTSYFVSKEALHFYPPFVPGVQHTVNSMLGGEYYSIAESLAAGKGYSSPFRVDTGPTAWQPPVYPLLLAGLIMLLPAKFFVSLVVLIFKNIVLVTTGLVLYEIARRTRVRLRAVWVVYLYCLWLLCYFRWFFQFSHDEWIVLFFMNLVFCGAVFISKYPLNMLSAFGWGAIGGLVMLTTPIGGLVWIVLSIGSLFAQNTKKIVFAFCVMGLFISPWVARNYVVFEKVILMKSNFYFDVYHNNQTFDGIVYDTYEIEEHPYFTVSADPESLYKQVGEAEFLDVYREKFFRDIMEHPDKYLTNIKNRFLAALIIFYPYTEHELFLPWQAFFHSLPLTGILLLAFFRQARHAHYFRIALLMYVVYLTPYILVSYYTRYSIGLTQLKILFIFWAIDLGVFHLRRIRVKFLNSPRAIT